MANGLASEHAIKTAGENVMIYPCGFAWVQVKPANSKFAKWLVENDHARKDSYEGGVKIWIGQYNQSVSHKEAHAEKLAEILKKEITDCKSINAGSRWD